MTSTETQDLIKLITKHNQAYDYWLNSDSPEEHEFCAMPGIFGEVVPDWVNGGDADRCNIALIAYKQLLGSFFGSKLSVEHIDFEGGYLECHVGSETLYFSGDTILTWKSASHVTHKNGLEYKMKRQFIVPRNQNSHMIGNFMPMICHPSGKSKGLSLNCARNGAYGRYPHDYFDLFLKHILAYAPFNIESTCFSLENNPLPKEQVYQPLVDAILDESNRPYFMLFDSFDKYVELNILHDADLDLGFTNKKKGLITQFSQMPFEEYLKTSQQVILARGRTIVRLLSDLPDILESE